jgi:MoaA/NifB/PqqE/SkfB family radical SAM enzyme
MSDVLLSQFNQRLDAKARQRRTPVSAMFEITPRCNLRCHFCYVALDPYQGPYLSTEQCLAVIDRLADAGVLFLGLTGGEILSRRDFTTLYRHARGRGMLVSLLTNATMVSEEVAQLLRDEPPHEVEVSIYGADAEHYEAVTGVKGSFERFVRGIDRLQWAGVRLSLKHPISNMTEDHVDAISAWCKARGIRHRFDAVIENRHDGGDQPSLYRIQPRRVNAIKDDIEVARTGRKRALPMASCAPVDEDPDAPEMLYRCSAGKGSLFVDARGLASHCIIDRDPAFPILEMPWDELWAAMGAWVTQPLPADAPCAGCGLRAGCDNCPARSRLATGSPFLRDQYHCDITHTAFGYEPGESGRVRAAARPVAACAR